MVGVRIRLWIAPQMLQVVVESNVRPGTGLAIDTPRTVTEGLALQEVVVFELRVFSGEGPEEALILFDQ